MSRSLCIYSLKLSVCASLMLVVSCNSGSKQTEAKLEEMQKQLDETKKELEASKEKVADAASEAATKASNAVKEGAANTAAAAKTAANKTVAATQKTATKGATLTQEQIDAAKTTMSENKAGIAANRADIEKGKVAIQDTRERADRAQATAEEAKRIAAPAPYHTLAAGTPIAVRTTSLITTKRASTGSVFEATLTEPLVVDGYTVAGKGAEVAGVVTNADPGGRVKGVASISVALRSVTMDDGRRLAIRTDSVSAEAKKSTKKDALKIGIGSGIGAAIGAIAGGGKGAAIGAGAGAAGGTGMALATKGEAAEIPSETVLNFALSAPTKFQELRK